MTDLEKILAAAAASFATGIVAGIFLEKYREKRRAYEAVLSEYLKAVAAPDVNENEYLRFAALQRAGAWRLSLRELRRLAYDIRGRGFLDPYAAWSEAFPEQKDFPKSFLAWAQKKNVDLAKPDDALRAMAEEFDARNTSKPPDAGLLFL